MTKFVMPNQISFFFEYDSANMAVPNINITSQDAGINIFRVSFKEYFFDIVVNVVNYLSVPFDAKWIGNN